MFAASPGASSAVGPTSGSKIYGFNTISPTPTVVAQANPNRAAITFHNPGPATIYIAPSAIQGLNTAPTTPVDQAFNPTANALGGCFALQGNGSQMTFVGECQKAWQAFSSGGVNVPLTVIESNQ